MAQGKDKVNKEKVLEAVLKQIEKQYGKGAVMKLGEHIAINVDIIPTGSLKLDYALGVGGYPRGRIIEIFGPESSGKTTLALQAIAEVHKMGGKAAFIDAEHALDPNYAKALGVNVDDLLVAQPDTGEQALEIADMLTRSNAIDLIVVDSVAALVPRAELEGDMTDSQVGLQARLMAKAMRKLSGALSRSKTCAIFINQIRQKVNTRFAFGNPETTPGGLALKFHASVRLDIRRIATLKSREGAPIANRVRVKVVKNKVAPPFREVEFDIVFGKGISLEGEIIDLGLQLGLIKKSGTWYTLVETGDTFQGTERLKEKLIENPELFKKLFLTIREKLGLPMVGKEWERPTQTVIMEENIEAEEALEEPDIEE